MISARRIMGIETEYAAIDRVNPGCDPEKLATDLLYAYAEEATRLGLPTTTHVPAPVGRELLPGAGCRFDYSGELPEADARGFLEENLPEEARTNEELGAVLTGSSTRWVQRLSKFSAHFYRGSATHAVNGGRLYTDHSHPEYASPETTNPRDCATWDRAGDLILLRAARALNSKGPDHNVVIFKNNVDGKGQAWGAHESYELRRDVDWQLVTDALIPFLTTRQVYCGSGRVGIGTRSEEAGFQMFQRADFVEREVSLFTTRERPIVNTRDEPHADPQVRRRLHIITADSLISGIASMLRLGTLACLLSLLENYPDEVAELSEELRLKNPVEAIRVISRDLELKAKLPLRSGEAATALEIQRRFLDLAREHAQGTDAETEEILQLWEEALDALSTGTAQAASYVEWCAKYEILNRMRQKFRCGWDDPRIRAADLQFASIDPASSLGLALERSGTLRKVLDSAAITKAEFNAPNDTRAGGRAALLEKYQDLIWGASWTSVVADIGRESYLRVSLLDPYHPTRAEVEAAIKGSGSVVETLQKLGIEIPEDSKKLSWYEGVYEQEERDKQGKKDE